MTLLITVIARDFSYIFLTAITLLFLLGSVSLGGIGFSAILAGGETSFF